MILDISFCADAPKCPKAATCKRNFERIRPSVEANTLISMAPFMIPETTDCDYYWPTEDTK